MFFLCDECGHTFEDVHELTTSVGIVPRCPNCQSSAVTAACKCLRCGKPKDIFSLTDGFCDDCIEQEKQKMKYDFERCMRIAEKESVEINGFLLAQFTPAEIEAVLYRELKEASAIYPIDCTTFLEVNAAWLNDRITEEMEGT